MPGGLFWLAPGKKNSGKKKVRVEKRNGLPKGGVTTLKISPETLSRKLESLPRSGEKKRGKATRVYWPRPALHSLGQTEWKRKRTSVIKDFDFAITARRGRREIYRNVQEVYDDFVDEFLTDRA